MNLSNNLGHTQDTEWIWLWTKTMNQGNQDHAVCYLVEFDEDSWTIMLAKSTKHPLMVLDSVVILFYRWSPHIYLLVWTDNFHSSTFYNL